MSFTAILSDILGSVTANICWISICLGCTAGLVNINALIYWICSPFLLVSLFFHGRTILREASVSVPALLLCLFNGSVCLLVWS